MPLRLWTAARHVPRLASAHPIPAAAVAAAVVLIPLARAAADRRPAGGIDAAELLTVVAEVSVEPPFEPPFETGGRSRIATEILGAAAALALEDGGWIVLDAASGRLHRIGPGLEHVWSTPGEGDGPGGLRRPVGVVPWRDGYAVMDGTVRRLDLFDTGGVHLGRKRLAVPDCGASFATAVLPSPAGGAALLIRCAGPGGFTWRMGTLDPDAPSRAGLTPLDVTLLPEDLLERSAAGDRDARWQDRILLRWNGGWWVGVVGGACLVALEGKGLACHPDDSPVSLPDSLRRRASRLPGGPAPVRYPPFLGASPSPRGPLLHVPVDRGAPRGGDEGEAATAYDLIRRDGTILRLHSAAFRAFFGGESILLVEPRLEGTELTAVPWPAAARAPSP